MGEEEGKCTRCTILFSLPEIDGTVPFISALRSGSGMGVLASPALFLTPPLSLIDRHNISSFWSSADFSNCTDIDAIQVSAGSPAPRGPVTPMAPRRRS